MGNGILEIKYLKNNTVEYLSYFTLTQLSNKSKKDKMESIYKPYHLKQLSLRCLCIESGVEMTIVYIEPTDTYYLRSFKNQAKNHDCNCHFYKENSLSSNSIYQTGWIIDDDGNFHISLNSHDYKIRKRTRDEPLTQSPSPITVEQGESSISQTKASLNQVIKQMVTKAWNDYILFEATKYGYPTISTIFNKVYRTSSKRFFIGKDLTLHHVIFDKGKIGRLHYIQDEYKKKSQPFVLLLLNNMVEVLDDNSYIITATNPVTDAKYQFSAPSYLVDAANRNILVSSGPYIIGGFVEWYGYNKMPGFLSMSLLAINDFGVPIESSYEREFYNYLCKNKRIIERPIESRFHPKFSGLLPDGLLHDTTPRTIIEIFGMSESNKEYHVHREYKIKYFEELIPNYHLWYWDAFNGSEMPKLPDKLH